MVRLSLVGSRIFTRDKSRKSKGPRQRAERATVQGKETRSRQGAERARVQGTEQREQGSKAQSREGSRARRGEGSEARRRENQGPRHRAETEWEPVERRAPGGADTMTTAADTAHTITILDHT